jgi:DNA-binding HxlR family transcriptional regulator
VHREASPTNPPYVEYSLTPLGQQIATRLTSLIEFVEDHMPEVTAARDRYDAVDPA